MHPTARSLAAVALLAAFGLAPGTVPPAAGAGDAAAAQVADRLVGSWRLESRVTTAPDGRVLDDPGLSATPSGLLIYDSAGHVAVQLARPGRTLDTLAAECRDAVGIRGTGDTAQTVLGYDAYFGTYTVDATAAVVTHHLESALYPGDIGKDIRRSFVLSADTLTLAFRTTLRDGTAVLRTLRWRRIR